MTFILALFGVLILGVFLVIFGTVTKNRWGINLDPNTCPTCKAEIPRVRKPDSLGQALWGGYTCKVCDSEVRQMGSAHSKDR